MVNIVEQLEKHADKHSSNSIHCNDSYFGCVMILSTQHSETESKIVATITFDMEFLKLLQRHFIAFLCDWENFQLMQAFFLIIRPSFSI